MKLQEVPQNIDLAAKKLAIVFQDANFVVCNEIYGQMLGRVFTRGENSYNERIGGYISPQYMKKRRNAGRQVGYVDAEFTGHLRHSIKAGRDDQKSVVGIIASEDKTGVTAAEKSKLLEKRYGQIFIPSDQEKIIARNIMQKFIADELQKIFK